MLDVFKQILDQILSASSSILLASEKKDSNGDAPLDDLFFSAIKSGNLDEVKRIIKEDRSVLGRVDSDRCTPIFYAIKGGNLGIIKEIINNDPLVLKRKDSNGITPIFYAIKGGNLEIIKEIIADPSVVRQVLSNGDTPILYAIQSGQTEIIKEIIEKYPSVLEQKDSNGRTPILYAIQSGQPEIIKEIIEKYPSVLEQKDSNGRTPILYAIQSGQPEIVEMIIKKDRSVLNQIDRNGNAPIDLAITISVSSSGRDNEDKASRVLNKVLESKFLGNIDKASQEDFKELFLKKILLKGIYSKEDAPFYFKCLEKAFDKITPENTFNKIYQDLFENVDKNQPINLKNDKNMYIFKSDLKEHSSFFIFHVNKANELTSISYCDGHTIDKRRKIEGSATHINGVTTFKLTTPIEYSYEKFVKNFIEKNSENKSIEDFYEKFTKNAIQGVDIDYEKTTHSIPTKIQKRGNCTFKSTSLAARFILEAIDPTMKFGFDMASQKPTGAGYGEYKEFKDGLTKNTLDSIIKIKEDISSKSDSFSDYLREEIEDIMKIAMEYNTKKLSNDDQPRKEFHKKMRDTLFPAHRNKDETPKASCFSFFTSCFSSSKAPQR